MVEVIAHWETRGNDFLTLSRTAHKQYSYRGNGCGGCFVAESDSAAIDRMNAPWGSKDGAGAVTVLQSDRPSLRRAY